MRPPSLEEAPHIAALQRSVRAGFQFLHLKDPEGRAVVAIYAERRRGGVVETYTLRGMTEAVAARFRAEDYPGGDPLWQHHGTVEEVVSELLALPPHDARAAPTISHRASNSLWVPGGS